MASDFDQVEDLFLPSRRGGGKIERSYQEKSPGFGGGLSPGVG